MTHPIDNVYVNAADVAKDDIKAFVKNRQRLLLTTAAEITTMNVGTQVGIDMLGVLYNLDAADTTTAHDGKYCLVSLDGKRFKRPSDPAFIGSNLFMNGGFDIWQRGTSFAISTYAYTADRWLGNSLNSGRTFTRSTDVPSNGLFQYSLKMQRDSGNATTGYLELDQQIESVNWKAALGSQVTLSFWAKKGANYSGGNLNVVLRTGTGVDQSTSSWGSWTGAAFQTNNKTLTTSWVQYTATFTITTAMTEAMLQFYWTPSGTAGADDSVFITGVQLEVGAYAGAFNRRPVAQELMLCKRYYQRISIDGVAYTPFGIGHGVSADTVRMPYKLEGEMRTTPSFGASAANTFQKSFGSNSLTTVAAAVLNKYSCSIDFTRTSEFTTNGAYMITAFAGAAAYLEFSAEL